MRLNRAVIRARERWVPVAVVLVLALALPVAGLLALPALPQAYAPRIGAATSAAVLALVVAVAAAFDYGHPERMQGVVNLPWAPTLGLRFHVGVDGVSLPLLVLTALLALLCQLYGLKVAPKGGSPRAFTALLLVLQIGMDGTFVALDLLLFFVFFETVLIPMWALIRWWGADGARLASTKFVLYTLLGSALMLVGFLVVYAHTGTLDMTALAGRRGAGMSAGTQELAFGLIALGLAVKTPMWPLHTWLPDAHTAAPTVGSVLLAGVLLKMGTYGFVRIAVPELPLGAHHFAPALAAFAVAGIVYAALACLAQARSRDGDLKRLIAYSSVGHMGFVLLGIATLTPVGVNGALFANVAHGLVTGLLFFLAGGLKERFGGTGFAEVGRGLYARAPRFGGLVVFAAMASLGLPGLAGFWGELLAMYGAARPAAGLSRGGFAAMLAVAGVGVVLTAAYLLAVVRRVCMGDPAASASSTDGGTPDLLRVELGSWLPLAALTLLAGLWPALLLDVTNPAVHALLAVR
jgi:NADH-quinone oxidoreductase subunit M